LPSRTYRWRRCIDNWGEVGGGKGIPALLQPWEKKKKAHHASSACSGGELISREVMAKKKIPKEMVTMIPRRRAHEGGIFRRSKRQGNQTDKALAIVRIHG